MRIAIVFIDDDKYSNNYINLLFYGSDLVITSQSPDLKAGNWVVEKDIQKPAIQGTVLVGGDTAAHAVQLAVLERLGLHDRVT
jgi:hypothetical protein